MRSPQNFGPIVSAVLTFIGHKQIVSQTDRQAKFIRRYIFASLHDLGRKTGKCFEFRDKLYSTHETFIDSVSH